MLYHLHHDGAPPMGSTIVIGALLATRSLDEELLLRLGADGQVRPVPSLQDRLKPKLAR